WVTAMGNLIAQQSGTLATQPIYKLTVNNNGTGGAYQASVTQLGASPANWADEEIVVLLDWSDVAGNLPPNGSQRPTPEIANFVGDELMTPGLIPGFAAPLAQLPIQMIGHSRGGSLISEIAR